MPFKEESRRPFKAPCACGHGFVRIYKVREINEFGNERETESPLEYHCDFCKQHYYHLPAPYTGGSLVPIGLSFPEKVPDLDRKYRLTGDESFIRAHSRDVIEAMIEDMETHRFMDRLQYEPASRYAYDHYVLFKKKALKPLIQNLRRILSNYESIQAGYLKKKPYVDAHDARVEEYNVRRHEVDSRSHDLFFEFDEEQYRAEQEQLTDQSGKHDNWYQSTTYNGNATYHDSCKVDSTGRYWASLHIEKCINPHCVIEKKLFSTLTERIIVKQYLCKCIVCGQEIEAYSSDFEIRYDDGRGYYPAIECRSCRPSTSFEAKTMEILLGFGISFVREYSFEGLVGDTGRPLRFDFALFDPSSCGDGGNSRIRLLLELQGPHHYKQGEYDEYGDFIEDKEKSSLRAKTRSEKQLRYDSMKQQYCDKHGIALELIKYTDSSYDKLEERITGILRKYGFEEKEDDLPF